MQKLQGIAVSPGVAIGEALVMDNEGFRIPRRFLARDAVENEMDRLGQAFDAAAAEIEHNRDAVARELGKQYGAIFEAHLQMLRDPRLRGELEQMVRERHYSPEYAVSRTLRRYAKVFQSLDSGYMAERANDIFDIEKRLLRNLLGRRREQISNLTSPVLVLAHNLTPSETANLDRRFVRGFVTEIGGAGSHTAIVAEGLEIPAVVGTGPFLTDVSGGDVVIIDGDQGLVILHPDEETIARYRHEVEQRRTMAARLESLRDLPAETRDGVRVQLDGNIEFPHEVAHCLERGADGIGLYRTEFLYLGAETEPDEEAHYRAYAEVVQAMAGRPVVIRTLDLGADKLTGQDLDIERNPFLGLRSIRISLRNTELFRTQLRAILRASALGDVRVMFPLISTMLELRQAKMVLADVMEDLEERGLPFHRDLKVGMMVEVPSVVVMIDHFVEEVDFLSIGTNDLIQYTLAVDRSNKDVAALYTASDPAILKLIELSVQAAGRRGIPVNLCGQMSGNPLYTMLLLGLGLRQMSVPPSAIPEIKKICRSVTIAQCEEVAARARRLEHARDVKRYLKEELKQVLPELVG
ncbi:MAG TPA: phosphoenolpyruvate--protein phosphotransferase [Pirellulales bacterium]|nr:phosphoenolpyruvate--protein phosphotransferase [Pirellulales bacterium]